MAHESSYGILPLCKEGSGWQILLIQHRTAKYWGFPKGHAEVGEEAKVAAIRELKEETNLEVVRFLSESILEEHYHFFWHGERIDKTVYFYIAEVSGTVELQLHEVSDSIWVPLNDAINHLTYDAEKSICRRAISLI